MAQWVIASEDRLWYVYDKEHDNCQDLFVKCKAQAESLAATLNRYELNYNTLVDSYDTLNGVKKQLEADNERLKQEVDYYREKAKMAL